MVGGEAPPFALGKVNKSHLAWHLMLLIAHSSLLRHEHI
jgi:hypothetical protein